MTGKQAALRPAATGTLHLIRYTFEVRVPAFAATVRGTVDRGGTLEDVDADMCLLAVRLLFRPVNRSRHRRTEPA